MQTRSNGPFFPKMGEFLWVFLHFPSFLSLSIIFFKLKRITHENACVITPSNSRHLQSIHGKNIFYTTKVPAGVHLWSASLVPPRSTVISSDLTRNNRTTWKNYKCINNSTYFFGSVEWWPSQKWNIFRFLSHARICVRVPHKRLKNNHWGVLIVCSERSQKNGHNCHDNELERV